MVVQDLVMQKYKSRNNKFEKFLSEERVRRSVSILKKFKHNDILEIGCGKSSILNYLKIEEFDRYTVIEPDDELKLNEIYDKITWYPYKFEDCANLLPNTYDFIVINSVLHTVKDPKLFLYWLKEICNDTTTIYLSVPNARSLHRLIGLNFGIITNIYDKSVLDKEFNYHSVFDIDKLRELVNSNGFKILEYVTYCLKPFSDKQMDNIINRELFDGLVDITYFNTNLSELGCEIGVLVTK